MHEHTLIKAGQIYSRSEGLLKGQNILIKNGIIERISSSANYAPDVKVLDYSIHTIAPSFCDHHVHFFDKSRHAVKETEKALLKHGILTVYDGGDIHMTASGIRDE